MSYSAISFLQLKCWRMYMNKNMFSTDSVIAEMSLLFLISWHFVAGLCAIWYVLTFSEHCVCCQGAVLHFCSVCKPQSLERVTPLKQDQCGGRCCFFFFFFLHKSLNKNIISQTTSTASHTICFLYLIPSKVICEDKRMQVTWIRLCEGLETAAQEKVQSSQVTATK